MADEEKQADNKEKEDNNLAIRYNKLKEKHSALEDKFADAQDKLDAATKSVTALTTKNVELDGQHKAVTQELQSSKELNGLTAKAMTHGVKDFDYFVFRVNKAKTEAGKDPFDFDKFIGNLKEESATKSMNLFGEKTVPATTSSVTNAPKQGNGAPSGAQSTAEKDEALKNSNFGKVVTLQMKDKMAAKAAK